MSSVVGESEEQNGNKTIQGVPSGLTLTILYVLTHNCLEGQTAIRTLKQSKAKVIWRMMQTRETDGLINESRASSQGLKYQYPYWMYCSHNGCRPEVQGGDPVSRGKPIAIRSSRPGPSPPLACAPVLSDPSRPPNSFHNVANTHTIPYGDYRDSILWVHLLRPFCKLSEGQVSIQRREERLEVPWTLPRGTQLHSPLLTLVAPVRIIYLIDSRYRCSWYMQLPRLGWDRSWSSLEGPAQQLSALRRPLWITSTAAGNARSFALKDCDIGRTLSLFNFASTWSSSRNSHNLRAEVGNLSPFSKKIYKLCLSQSLARPCPNGFSKLAEL